MKYFFCIFSVLFFISLFILPGCGSDEKDAPKPTIDFLINSSNVQEGSSITIAFNINLPNGVTPVYTLSGTATEGVDYTHSITTAGIVITASADFPLYDPDETIVIALTGFAGNAELGSQVSHTVTIKENPLIDFQLNSSDVQEGSSITIAFNITLPNGVTPVYTLSGTATVGVDYNHSITASGIIITASADFPLYDPDETIIVTLTGFTGNADLGNKVSHTVTIKETPLEVEFVAQSVTRVEGTNAIVSFSQELPAGVTPTYTISGTATQTNDYTFTQSSSGFNFTIKKDEIYDPNETVIIELTGFNGNVVVGAKKIFTITITDEDETKDPGLQIDLTWDAGGGTPGDVDMDLLLWLETSPGVYTAKGGLWSANIGPQFESVTIPVSETDGKWALSYVYYDGSSDDLKVNVAFRSFKGNINVTSNRATYSGTYKLVNINAYTDPYNQPDVVAQTFEKAANNYVNLTPFKVEASGSRSKPPIFILDDEARRIINEKLKAKSVNGNK